jgi:hypothetical protein
MVTRKVYKKYLEYYLLSPPPCDDDDDPVPTSLVLPRKIQEKMDNSEEDEGTAQLVSSEASAGTKGGGGDCNDLAIRRDVNANAHAGIRKGMGDLSSSNAK